MEQPLDVYADQFQVSTGPYSSSLTFLLSPAQPPAPGMPPQAERKATIRTSLEHLKLMAFMLHRQILMHERQAGVIIPLPVDVLNSLSIGQEDWDSFWKK